MESVTAISNKDIPRGRIALEGFVIVVSILLAFGIDAWWSGVQENRNERLLISNLREEFGAVRDTLQQGVELHRAIMESALVVAGYGGSPGQALPDVRNVVRTFVSLTTTQIKTGTLDGALASGRLHRLSDAELRAMLAAWPRTLSEFMEEEDHIAVLANEAQHVLARSAPFADLLIGFRLQPDTAQTAAPLSRALLRFLASEVGRNYAALRVNHEFLAIRDGERLLSAVDGLIARLAQERR